MPWTVSTVETVLGRVVIEDLGRILQQEHLCSLVRCTPPSQNSRTVMKRQGITLKTRDYMKEYPYCNESNLEINDTLQTALEYDLRLFRSRGGKTILENTSYDYEESDLQQIKALSRATGVNIILGTGCRPRTSEVHSVESAYNKFFGDLVEGIATPSGHSEVMAGFIGKIGLNWPLSQSGKNILAAAGEIQDQIKCVVSMEPGDNKASISEMIRHYEEGGGDQRKILMLHLDRVFKNAKDLTEYINCTEYYIGLDTFDNESFYYPFLPDVCTSNDEEWSSDEFIERVIKAKETHKTRRRCYGSDTFDKVNLYNFHFPDCSPDLRTRSDAECIKSIINAKERPMSRTWDYRFEIDTSTEYCCPGTLIQDGCMGSLAKGIKYSTYERETPRSPSPWEEPLKRILLSHNVQYKNQLKSFGGNGFVHIYDSILPALRKVEDFTEDEIDMLTVDNAQHWLRQ